MFFSFCSLISISLTHSTSLLAQTPAQNQIIRSTVEPSQVGRAVSPPPTITGPEIPPEMKLHLETGQNFSPEVAKHQFKLKKIIIKNPVVFTSKELIAPYHKYIGKTITVGTLQVIAKEITLKYQNAGYFLTRVIIPPQHIKDGIVTFEIIPGYIDKVSIQGHINPCLKERLCDFGEKIKQCKPLHIKTLERYSLLGNDIPGVTLNTVLTASKHTPGATDLIIKVDQECQSAYASVNNYGTSFLGPVQYIVGGTVNSFFNPGDSTSAQYVTTANKQLNFGELRHTELIGNEGMNGTIFGQTLTSHPGSSLAPLLITGKYNHYGAEVSYPFIRSREENLSFLGGFMLEESKSYALSQLLYDDRIRPLYLSLSYYRLDSLQGINQSDIRFTEGLNAFNPSRNTLLSRPNGKALFSKLNGSYMRLQPLTTCFSMFFIAQAQYSFDPLLAPQQFGFGGNTLGRGLDNSILIGDHGIAGSAELRYGELLPCKIFCTQWYAFIDSGQIWNRDTLNQFSTLSATSVGLGVRAKVYTNFEANLWMGRPIYLSNVLTGAVGKITRLYFSLIART